MLILKPKKPVLLQLIQYFMSEIKGISESLITTIPKKKQTINKSPQELAAQAQEVWGLNLDLTYHPDRENLEKRFSKYRTYIQGLLEAGVGDEQLQERLNRIYQKAFALGIYSPLKGKGSADFKRFLNQKYLEWGFGEPEADKKTNERLIRHGYLAKLRQQRHYYEDQVKKYFIDFNDQHPIDQTKEARRIEQLRERVVDLSDPEQAKTLSKRFPGGNFLYHGTSVEQAIKILESGGLFNVKALDEAEQKRAEETGADKKPVRRNSGYEGISWNYNQIGALPGDRYHLVGFLTSPQTVLAENQQLAIPSRPAPHELIQINGNIDSNKYYLYKTQLELLSALNLGEKNSVLSNIVQLSSYKEDQTRGEQSLLSRESMLQNYVNSDTDNQESVSELRSLYTIRENGTIELSFDLHQQINDDIPVAAVWFQALIDTGRIRNIVGFENSTTVREIVNKIDGENYKSFSAELRIERDYLEKSIGEEEDKITSLSVPVSKTFLVVPNTDLSRFLRILARCQTQPEAILVYDHKKVRLEHFASTHRGDNQVMTEILRTAIPVSEGYIDYETQILGTGISADKMVGYRKHVLGERFLENRKVLRKDDHGEIIVDD